MVTSKIYEGFMWNVEEYMRENDINVIFVDNFRDSEGMVFKVIIDGQYKELDFSKLDLTELEDFTEIFKYAHISRKVIGVYERYEILSYYRSEKDKIYEIKLYEGEERKWWNEEEEKRIEKACEEILREVATE